MRKKDNRPPKENRPPMPPTPPYPPYPNKRPKPFKPHNHRAHFAPPLMQYHIPHAFKFWCNQTLPFVYDDSLSFYELLNKVVHYMNNMFEDEKLMTVNIGELAEAYKALEQFVNDYFSFYQSKGLIVYDIPVTNANYREILPDCNTAQMNTIYRLLFVDDSTQNIPTNLPDDAKPFSDSESLLINISNFVLKFVGGVWQQPPVEENETAAENPNMIGNYQLLITDRNFFIRQHNGDTWGEWESIFGNWYAEIWEQIKEYVDTQDEAVKAELLETINNAVEDLTGLITAETNRATAAENALGLRIDANVTAITNEINRAMAAESDLSARITAEVNRATAAEDALDDKIEDEIDAREAADTALSNAITAETTRATNAENNLSAAITAEVSRATTAENDLSSRITAEVSRATAAENALSARIQTWETDLAAETLDRQQGDRALGLRIDGVVTDLASEVSRATAAETTLTNNLASEVSRATAAESGLQSDIGDVASDLSDFESEVRDGYIPNAGNNKASNFVLTRNGYSFNTLTSGYGFLLGNNDGLFNVQKALGSNVNPAIVRLSKTEFIIDPLDDTIIKKTERTIDGVVHSAKAYYGNSVAADNEIATVGNVNTAVDGLASESYVDDGYIPNEGNTVGTDLYISRDEISVTSHDNDLSLTADSGNVNITADVAYYNGTTPDDEIATKGDVDTATSGLASQSYVDDGYIPNAGNYKNDTVFAMIRKSYGFNAALGYSYLMGEGNGLFIVQHIIKSGVSPALFSLTNNEFIVDPVDDTWLKKTERTISGAVHSAKAYYGNAKTADNEIATKGDVSAATAGMATQSDLDGYVPNGGNDLSSESGSDFMIGRDDNITFETNASFNVSAADSMTIESTSSDLELHADGELLLYQSQTGAEIRFNTSGDVNIYPDNNTLIQGSGAQPDDFIDGITVFNERVYVQDQFTAAYDNTDRGRYGATTNKLELSNLGITGQTQHGIFVPELHHSPSTAVQPNDSLTSYANEKIVFDLKSGINYVYEDTLEIPANTNMTFNGAIESPTRTRISGDISTTPNSSLITLTDSVVKATFNNIIFDGKDPTSSQGAIIDCGEHEDIEIIFNNCTFNVTPYILKQFTCGKIVFKNCIFTANYAIQFSYTGNGDNAEIIVDSCVFAGAPSAIQLNANNAGCTFIITNNKVSAVTTNPISAFPSTVYEWNNSIVSSGYSETVLWTNPNIATNPNPNDSVTLNADITNFDAIYILAASVENNTIACFIPTTIPTAQLINNTSASPLIEIMWTYGTNLWFGAAYVDNTHIRVGGTRVAGSGVVGYYKIIGIKY